MNDSHEKADQVRKTEAQILAREVQALLLSTDLKVIQAAAAVGERLPPMHNDDGELLKISTLKGKIVQHLGETGIR